MVMWKSAKLRSFAQALLSIESEEEMLAFLRDAATLEELREMANRWAVVQQLEAGKSYREIAESFQISTATVARVAHWLNHGENGYRSVLNRKKNGT